MTAIRADGVDQMWRKLGFEIKQGKHVSASLTVNDKIVVTTRRSHGAGKLDGRIPIFIRQQMYLNQEQFDAAYQCPLKKPDYITILRSKGRLEEGA